MLFLQIKLDVLSVTILQFFLLSNCGYLRLVNGVPTVSTLTGSSAIEETTSSLNNESATSLDTTPISSVTSMESTEISPSSTIPDITTISESLDVSKSTNVNSPDIFSSEVSIAPSETSMFTSSTSFLVKVTESTVINSSFYPVNIAETSTLNTSLINHTSSFSDFLSRTSVMSDMSSAWLPSTILMSSSVEILPTKVITTDFATAVDHNTTATDMYQPENITTEFAMTVNADTTNMYEPENITTGFAMTVDTDTTTNDMYQTENITAEFATTVTNTTANNNTQSATITTSKNLTSKSSMSKSSKIAAGICIPLAILAILGITYVFYRRRHKDRSVKFTEKGSTWSYSNASFTDDAIKSTAQHS